MEKHIDQEYELAIITAIKRCITEVDTHGLRNCLVVKQENGKGRIVHTEDMLLFVNSLSSKLDKLKQIEQIVKDCECTTPSMIKQFSELQKILDEE